jgi:hypothetical protein
METPSGPPSLFPWTLTRSSRIHGPTASPSSPPAPARPVAGSHNVSLPGDARSGSVSRAGDPPFDWSDRGTWKSALADVDAAYLAYLPDIGAPQAADDLAAFADLATATGVRRVVLLSGRIRTHGATV